MQSWDKNEFAKRKSNLETRAEIIKKTRAWFDGGGFTEVQTPILQRMGAPDTHIKPFQTDGLELHTSPEIAMKKLLVAGMERIYQITPVFRREIEGRLHREEFTMLEWYRTGRDYAAMMDDCESLIQSLGLFTDAPFERLTVAEAFERYTNLSSCDSGCPWGMIAGSQADQTEPVVKPQGDVFRSKAKAMGIRTIPSDSFEDIFHAIMDEKIEPHLGQGRPTILYDYPASMASLAKKRGDVAERFELYINGIEIANAFTELTDPVEQRARLQEDLAQKKALYGIQTPLDEDFIAALKHGMPESTGCALGLDRLIMIVTGADHIKDVQWI
ncbi:MAG: EF-P lysine aminoacylase EpmA [Alphaproteobacteria bacterium]